MGNRLFARVIAIDGVRASKNQENEVVMFEGAGKKPRGGSEAGLVRVTMYTDGAAEPNPGSGGYGVVLLSGKHRKELSKGFQLTTNNRMELLAVIAGLEELTKPCIVTIVSDSKYVVESIDKGWVLKWQKKNWFRTKNERAKNADLWQRYLVAAQKHEVKMTWIKGHAGHDHNERCDELAGAAAKGTALEIDVGYQPDENPADEENVGESGLMTRVTVSGSKVTHKLPGEPCRKCGTPLVKAKPQRKKLKVTQTYYFEWYLHCPGCDEKYMVEEAKRMIDNSAQGRLIADE
ncbi:MAG TPA: ribonuclease HI [Planctomycetaceae bacterium]|nr:ribonuclease HI [Planctomycetaceae bacterium]HQZ65730.1 ribonuclease HI [Planctomycetaceae bacterium]